MSNPGVMIVGQTPNRRFRVEDNIGEAIHLHYKDIRIDLTLQELYELERVMVSVVNELKNIEGFDVDKIDPVYLGEILSFIPNIKEVKEEIINLSELRVDTLGVFGLPVIRRLNKSRVYKALNGNNTENDNRKQYNLYGESNGDRLKRNQEYIASIDNVEELGAFVTLYNDSNIIKDGQHRAAILYNMYGNSEIKVTRYYISNLKRIDKTLHPWFYFLFFWNKQRIRKVLVKVYRYVKKMVSRIKDKLKLY